jgi:hypothetical protein
MTSRRSCASEEVANTSMNSVWMSCVGALGADEYQELRFATSSNAELLQETVTFKLLLRVRLLLGGGFRSLVCKKGESTNMTYTPFENSYCMQLQSTNTNMKL